MSKEQRDLDIYSERVRRVDMRSLTQRIGVTGSNRIQDRRGHVLLIDACWLGKENPENLCDLGYGRVEDKKPRP
jgi:hypothetical protein